MIDSYTFGEIVIDGSRYEADVLVFPDGRVDHTWWRKEGHRLGLEDIEDLIASQPEWIVAGTGAYGMMKVEADVIETLEKQGIRFEALPTPEAVKLYNDLRESSSVAGCFHLTC